MYYLVTVCHSVIYITLLLAPQKPQKAIQAALVNKNMSLIACRGKRRLNTYKNIKIFQQCFNEGIYSFHYEAILNPPSSRLPLSYSDPLQLLHSNSYINTSTMFVLFYLECLWISEPACGRHVADETLNWTDDVRLQREYTAGLDAIIGRWEMEAKQACRHQTRFWIFESSPSLWGWVDIIYEEEMQ